ncbi:MAG: 50S ribosomal protein L6 [bacterium]|nr:50S ribosomal protein L6 [bacterium]
MSKIARKPIEIPEGVELKKEGDTLFFKGKNGEEKVNILAGVNVDIKDKEINLSIDSPKKQPRSNWGTLGSLIKNAIEGVTQGFEKTLEVEGVGYKVAMEGKTLVLNLGFSHPIKYEAKEGVEISVDGNNKVIIKGSSKQAVGQTAAEIRSYRKPEPYKGKGVHYTGEIIRRKAGKRVGAE